MATKIYSGNKYVGTDQWPGRSAALNSKPYTPPGGSTKVSGGNRPAPKPAPKSAPKKGTKMTPAAVTKRKRSKISNAAGKVLGGLYSK